jgi:hypothetical protein
MILLSSRPFPQVHTSSLFFPTHHDTEHTLPTHDSIPNTQRDPHMGARAALDFAVSKLGPDEVRVLTRIADRLALGRAQYGALDIANDRRAFRGHEAREEVEDALVYFACAWLKNEEVAA